jgi:hypothetical protein
MDVRNADSLPRVGVCFFRDGSLSALAPWWVAYCPCPPLRSSRRELPAASYSLAGDGRREDLA